MPGVYSWAFRAGFRRNAFGYSRSATPCYSALFRAGRVDEAYARYAIRATSANTNIATYRALAKRYPGVEPSRILGDLIASTPGEEGKWFATAKTLKQYDLALARSQVCGSRNKWLALEARLPGYGSAWGLTPHEYAGLMASRLGSRNGTRPPTVQVESQVSRRAHSSL
jgi:hypothetical protein